MVFVPENGAIYGEWTVLLRCFSKSNGCINPERTPTARYQQGKLHYVVTDHQGTLREIFSEGGQASWAGRLNTWGQMQFWRYREGKAENDPNYTECPFRFAGQYEDEESGLYYNRFRYYMIGKQGSIFLQTR